MIKIRLEGLPAQVNAVAWLIRQMPALRVLQESSDYPNRGKSEFVRRYLDVTFKEEPDERTD